MAAVIGARAHSFQSSIRTAAKKVYCGGTTRAFSAAENNFGGPNGPSITNKRTILDNVDVALGCSPPDVEILLADHLAFVGDPLSEFCHATVLRFGHVAVRYVSQYHCSS